MDRKEYLTCLARMIADARDAETDGGNRVQSRLPAVLRSLRATYLSLAAGLPLGAVAGEGFLLEITARGTFRLLQGGSLVPAHSAYLQFLFRSAGVALPLGRTILLDAELAKEAVEDGLWSIGLRQAIAERRRTNLARAMADRHGSARLADLPALRALESTIDRLAEMKVDLVAASLAADSLLERRTGPDSEVA